MLSKRDGPGAIGVVVLTATFRLLLEHPVCSALLFSTVVLLCLSLKLLFRNGVIVICLTARTITIVKSNVSNKWQ